MRSNDYLGRGGRRVLAYNAMAIFFSPRLSISVYRVCDTNFTLKGRKRWDYIPQNSFVSLSSVRQGHFLYNANNKMNIENTH